jgi:pimeloyl-ACP methyl ester carboxylesterase
MFEEKTIVAENISISCKIWTGKTEKTIVCLHGWLDNAASFDLLAPFLSDYTIVAVDLPGHGKSAHLPPAAYYHFIDAISHLQAITNALDLTDYVLMGHSLGACIASMAAGVQTSPISALILLDAIGPLTSSAQESAADYHRYLKTLPLIQKRKKRYYKDIEEAAEARAKKGYLSPTLTQIIASRGLQESADGFYWRHDPRLLLPSPLRMTEEQVLPFLQRVNAPTLLITAKNGFQYDKEKAKRRIKSIADITHISLSGGHHIHMEEPQHCANAINDFLRKK